MTDKTYWAGNGRYETLSALLDHFLPARGFLPDDVPAARELNELTKANNAYWDLYNNGGGNRDLDIARFAKLRELGVDEDDEDAVFGFLRKRENIKLTYPRMEVAVDEAIMAATTALLGALAAMKEPEYETIAGRRKRMGVA